MTTAENLLIRFLAFSVDVRSSKPLPDTNSDGKAHRLSESERFTYVEICSFRTYYCFSVCISFTTVRFL